jgi:hypothetical protein
MVSSPLFFRAKNPDAAAGALQTAILRTLAMGVPGGRLPILMSTPRVYFVKKFSSGAQRCLQGGAIFFIESFDA